MKKKESAGSYKSFPLLLGLFIFIVVFSFLGKTIFTGNHYKTEAAVNRKTDLANYVISSSGFSTSSSLVPLISYPASYEASKPVLLPARKDSGFCLRVPVLTYHHIRPQSQAMQLKQTALSVDSEVFDQQMAYLSQSGYTPIFANELFNALKNHIQLPGKPIVITMDDGYADNDIYALPVLKKYAIKANLMLASGLMGNPDMLSWDQVQDLKNSGLFYFTNHTWSHFAVNQGSQTKLDTEIDTAAGQIKEHTQQDINIFTYPFGSFSESAIAVLEKKGYLGAFSTISGQVQCDSFLMTLHRTRIGNSSLSSYGI